MISILACLDFVLSKSKQAFFIPIFPKIRKKMQKESVNPEDNSGISFRSFCRFRNLADKNQIPSSHWSLALFLGSYFYFPQISCFFSHECTNIFLFLYFILSTFLSPLSK